ncbi:Golgi transport complex subunit 4 [Emydomyces testavorans]|uniref:Conserved oligomeric Golgi complex subunit 4 n=1 Tax=Emydomyces testavorans TaxID=2070801 RepID=A0AAF0IKB9_9EURO|nr:Golgi transport complex subunit 4 [Emydomyces testavorans]
MPSLLNGALPASTDDCPSINDAATLSDVRSVLVALHERESQVTARLDALLQTQSTLSRELRSLDLVGSQVIATHAMGNEKLASATDAASRLSHRIKALDLEKRRVEYTLGVVEQVAELKTCVHGAVSSMGAPQDWEAAARYIARASKVPEEIIKGGFASSIVPSVEIPDPPWVMLEMAKESLCNRFVREFEEAVKEGDGVKMMRYFKLFPRIGRSDVGLDVYKSYVCQGVAATARARLRNAPTTTAEKEAARPFYVNALTKLFEHIAQIVEGHGKLVEQHYGAGKMVEVIERLQMETDVQGGMILDSWNHDRAVERWVTDVQSFLLLENFLPLQKGGMPRMNSPMMRRGADKMRKSEDEGVNLKEVYGLLNEIAAMLGTWSFYIRFITRKYRDLLDMDCDPAAIPDVLAKSNLSRKISAKLTTSYNIMATFFFSRSVERAFQIDDYPSGLSLYLNQPIDASPPFIISAVEDVIFIVNIAIRESLATSQKEVAAHVITTISRILGSDLVGAIRHKMRDETYPKPVVQGGFPPEDKIILFIVLINSLDMANEYLVRIVFTHLGVNLDLENSLTKSSPIRDAFPAIKDASFVADSLSDLVQFFTIKTTELLNEGLQVLFNNIVKPRLRRIISDTFRDTDYSITEEELDDLAVDEDEGTHSSDHVARTFEHGWDQLMRPVARIMTAKTFTALLGITARYIADQVLEKRVWSYTRQASALGAVRMERDFSSIANVVTRDNYSVRKVFAKVLQILMVVNMEEEWDAVNNEDGGEDGILWVLTKEERAKAKALVKG